MQWSQKGTNIAQPSSHLGGASDGAHLSSISLPSTLHECEIKVHNFPQNSLLQK